MRVIEDDNLNMTELQVGDILRVIDRGDKEPEYRLVVKLNYDEYGTVDLDTCNVISREDTLADLLEYYEDTWDVVNIIKKEIITINLGGK